DEAEEGSVVGEIRRGYRMGDRVVRPSRVAVATKPEQNELNQVAASEEPSADSS
ncbi:MAG: nucleotide exchange factor GrpE, partial [Armatimonadetes bacterium]|nr:nucleotide exchange factor GrpE [Armatimonadota bacterium]NIM23578.1 nucleotide exchange factor GrpE [Armatimonadota bacterium]NIM67444.1 nucleotide exchange factor GrpE [Armatimonadota bacterium]NIM75945.1 nucleotide exchange factor GrpE [Armatimonadota bacterium]NIN05630.1 nucleotide exchange factor GrpE [Armatimonadota bacterium]